MLKTPPVVFAVAREYQIMVPVEAECVMWVQVGDETYYDDSNGILRSSRPIHSVSVPCEALNRAGRYTICTRKIVERKPYYPILEDEVCASFDFIPVPENRSLRFFVVADAHNHAEPAIKAARAYGEIDFLILNGDIPNHSGDIANFDIIYQIAGEITQGRIPVVFARGNHDLRGVHAEDLADYTPSDGGRTYFTFRLGDVWGIALDCGEDKLDSQEEYGGTICCHDFRLRETAFLRRVIANAKDEYEAPGVRLRLVVAHNPFSQVLEPPFDIERDLYREWCRLIKESIHPQLMLCGHIHRRYISLPGSQYDQLGQPCPMIVCSEVRDGRFTFCGVRVDDYETAQVSFVNGDGSLADTASVPLAEPSR